LLVATCQSCLTSRDDLILLGDTDSRCGRGLDAVITQLKQHVSIYVGDWFMDFAAVQDTQGLFLRCATGAEDDWSRDDDPNDDACSELSRNWKHGSFLRWSLYVTDE
jgi:hypothetical protein